MREPQDADAALPSGSSVFQEQLQAFAADLRDLRIGRGNPALSLISTRSKKGSRVLSVSAISEALNGRRLPGWEFYTALVETLLSWDEDGRQFRVERRSPEFKAWAERWKTLEGLRQQSSRKSRSARTASSPAVPAREEAGEESTAPSAAPEHRQIEAGHRVFALGTDFTGDTDVFRKAAFSADGRWLVVADGSVIQVWDPAAGQQIERMQMNAAVSAVALSFDGRLLAFAYSGQVHLRDLETGQQVEPTLTGHAGDVWAMAFSPDGQLLATSDDQVVKLWDLRTDQACGTASIHRARPFPAVAFSVGGQLLAVVDGAAVTLWSPTSGREIRPALSGHAGVVKVVAFSPDGQLIATGSDDNTVMLWAAATSQEARPPLKGHSHGISAMAFSLDGLILATAAGDTVCLWDTSTGQQVDSAKSGHIGEIVAMAFSPEGGLLSTVSNDSSLRLHRVGRMELPSEGPATASSELPPNILSSNDSPELVHVEAGTLQEIRKSMVAWNDALQTFVEQGGRDNGGRHVPLNGANADRVAKWQPTEVVDLAVSLRLCNHSVALAGSLTGDAVLAAAALRQDPWTVGTLLFGALDAAGLHADSQRLLALIAVERPTDDVLGVYLALVGDDREDLSSCLVELFRQHRPAPDVAVLAEAIRTAGQSKPFQENAALLLGRAQTA